MSGPRAIACPRCGGSVAPPLASRRTECRFCSEGHYYIGRDFLPSLAFHPRVEESALKLSLRSLFHSALLPADFASQALLMRSWRTYIPFYLLTGKRGGLLTAGRERVVLEERSPLPDGEGMRPSPRRMPAKVKMVREPDARVALGDFRYLYSAASLAAWGLRDEEMRGEILQNLDLAEPASKAALARDGEVVDPDLPLEQIVQRGVAAQETSGDLKVLDLQAALVYVPVRSFVFRYRGGYALVRAEELTGAPLAGHLPFRRDWYALLGLPVVAGLGLVTGLSLKVFGLAPASELFQAAFVLGPLPCVFFLGAAALLAFGLSSAWEVMRRPSRVAVVPGGLRWEPAAKAPDDPFSGASELFWELLKTAASGREGRG